MNRPANFIAKISEIFGPDGVLSQKLPMYEYRPGQLKMAEAVAQALSIESDKASKLAVEAGTGIGKTLAYLVPAALSRRKIIVSTGTLNLQDQILNKEIPFIKKHIDQELSALCVKGRQNYICLYRFKQLAATPQANLSEQTAEFTEIAEWLKKTATGDRAELSWLPDNSPLWHDISSTASQCLGIHCPEGPSCFINELRKRAARTPLLIVNHHLFFSDLALRRFGFAEVLPRYESVIFDEAHHLENVATRYFGISFSLYQLLDLVQDIEKLAETSMKKQDQGEIIQTARAAATQANLFAGLFPRERGRFHLTDFIDKTPSWESELNSLDERITSLCRRLEPLLVLSEAYNGMLRRCEELLTNLKMVTAEENPSYVFWYERRERSLLLSASPIEIATEMREHLYEQTKSVIFTSATLTTSGDFTYLFDRLGLSDDTTRETIHTPFDYKGRTLLYIPDNNFPQPGHPSFFDELERKIYDILMASNGRALLLFTSVNGMKTVYNSLSGRLPFPLLIQGSAPRSVLLETFQKRTDSVLLGVASFWEGVNVPGEALSCLIIDKLPFEVPNDPVLMARVNKIREQGGNPFFDFQVPRAILALRQGVGRLMRNATDRGLIAIMDVRLFTKRYGRTFLKSLPASPVTRDQADIELFFSKDVTIQRDAEI